MGECDTRNLVITINAELPLSQVRDTLLHEAMHAAIYVAGGWSKDIDEDAAVGKITSILLDTMQRNPDFVAFLVGEP